MISRLVMSVAHLVVALTASYGPRGCAAARPSSHAFFTALHTPVHTLYAHPQASLQEDGDCVISCNGEEVPYDPSKVPAEYECWGTFKLECCGESDGKSFSQTVTCDGAYTFLPFSEPDSTSSARRNPSDNEKEAGHLGDNEKFTGLSCDGTLTSFANLQRSSPEPPHSKLSPHVVQEQQQQQEEHKQLGALLADNVQRWLVSGHPETPALAAHDQSSEDEAELSSADVKSVQEVMISTYHCSGVFEQILEYGKGYGFSNEITCEFDAFEANAVRAFAPGTAQDDINKEVDAAKEYLERHSPVGAAASTASLRSPVKATIASLTSPYKGEGFDDGEAPVHPKLQCKSVTPAVSCNGKDVTWFTRLLCRGTLKAGVAGEVQGRKQDVCFDASVKCSGSASITGEMCAGQFMLNQSYLVQDKETGKEKAIQVLHLNKGLWMKRSVMVAWSGTMLTSHGRSSIHMCAKPEVESKHGKAQ